MNKRVLCLALLFASNVLAGSLSSSYRANLSNIGDFVGYSGETGMVTFLGSSSDRGIQVPEATAPGLLAEDRAGALLAEYAPLFGEDNPGQNLEIITSFSPHQNQKTHRYQQTYQGIPILAAELIVNMTTEGGMLSMNGELSPDIDLSVTPTISADQALQQVYDLFELSYQAAPGEIAVTGPDLWIFDERLLVASDRPAELVWLIEAGLADRPVNELVLVNAETGRISLHFNQIDTSWEEPVNSTAIPTLSSNLLTADLLSVIPLYQPNSTDSQDHQTGTVMAAEIEVVSGSGQSADLTTPFGQPLIVIASNLNGDPLPGVEITFSAPQGHLPSATFGLSDAGEITVTTGEDGTAHSPMIFANQINGAYTITATTPGVGTVLQFELENTDGPYWYVRTSGDDTANDCRSPETACASVQAVFSKTGFEERDTILIEAGVYTGSGEFIILIENSVNLRGGWDETFSTQSGYSTFDGELARGGLSSNQYLDKNYLLLLQNLDFTNGGTAAFDYGNLLLYNITGAIENCEIRNGTGTGVILYSSMVYIKNVEIHHNTGNGIMTNQWGRPGSTHISQSAVYSNQKTGIYAFQAGLYIQNTTISGNIEPAGNGGGIYFNPFSDSHSLFINNVTIVGNQAAQGAGIYTLGNTYLQNSLVARNYTGAGAPANCWSGITSNGYNILDSLNNCFFTPAVGDQTGIDIQLSPLLDFNGAAPMHALLTPSPAIDSANPAAPSSSDEACVSIDQRDMPRPVDGDFDGTAYCDIGAFEYQGADETPSYILSPNEAITIFRTNETNPNAFEVIILGPNGGEVSGVPVTFSVPDEGPGGAFDGSPSITVLTDLSGKAQSGPFTANGEIGSYQVEVTVEGIDVSYSIEVRNVRAQLSTYDMHHTILDLPGSFLCDEHIIPCTGSRIPDANFAHLYALLIHEFYLERHDRDSFDALGGEIISSVRYSYSYQNAFWDGAQLVYGDDFPQADDLVSHEYTHAVTDYASNLYDYYQSGAISESLSDIWGEAFDQHTDSGFDQPEYDWLIGEALPSGPMRSMSDPTTYLHPDKITSPYYHLGDLETPDTPAFDNGGVHTNSGINNKAAYLMVQGGAFNGYTVSGIGWEKMLAIYYEVQTTLLTSGADYGDLYYAVQQACTNLTGGPEGISSDDCLQVKNALDAVEMNLQPVANFNPNAAICGSEFVVNELFYDGFESGTSLWDFTSTSSTGSNWNWSDGYASNGSHMIEFYDHGGLSTVRAILAGSVDLPAVGAHYLHFDHSFGFNFFFGPDNDRYFTEGGILQVQVDEGSWQDASAYFDDGLSYNGVVHIESDSGFSGSTAFVADSHGYVSSRYDLSSLAGHAVRFRFVVKTDSLLVGSSWFVDEFRIYSCDPPAPQAGPTAVTASDGEFSFVQISWDNLTGASEYQIYRDTNSDGITMAQIGTSTATSYKDSTAEDLTTYYYWVSACTISGCSPLSDPDDGYADYSMTSFIFEDDFETGDLSLWSRVNDSGGYLYACTDGAINGSYGVCVARGDNDKRKQLTDLTPVYQTSFSTQFGFDINSLHMGQGERFRFMQVKMDQERPFFLVVKYDSGQYMIQLNTKLDDLSKVKSDWIMLTDAPHTIEVDWQAATFDGANNGLTELYIDGILVAALTGLDNDTLYIDKFKLGFTSTLYGKDIDGIFYLDDVYTSSNGYIGNP